MKTKTALVVDDDARLIRLARKALEARGFEVEVAAEAREALEIAAIRDIDLAVIETRFRTMTFSTFLEELHATMPEGRILIHTHYGSIAGAVFALQAGAEAYLEKSGSLAALEAAIDGGGAEVEIREDPMTPSRMKWEHLNRVWIACGENVSDTARRLGMHRRSLQRMLQKRSPA
jgi:two-component system, response regulator RegA